MKHTAYVVMVLLTSCPLLRVGAAPAPAPGAQVHVTVGEAAIPLDGPWKFHLGDNPGWAEPGIDDSNWESVDLTPPPGARDDDVGLSGYVPGWQARGHAGYYGYAWYRLRAIVNAPPRSTLAIAGPFAVDSAYQLYANGRLLGGVGDFSTRTPTSYSDHRPMLFTLSPDTRAAGSVVLAVRVWLATWPHVPNEGGIHIAPMIGSLEAVTAQYRLQWLTLFEGYVVDGVEGVLLLLLALMVLSIMPFDRGDRALPWIAAASGLLAIHRGNQAVMFLGDFESLREFELLILVLAIPLYTGAWVIAWRKWLKLRHAPWVESAVLALTIAYMVAVFVSRSWFRSVLPGAVFIVSPDLIACARWGLLLLYAFTAFQGVRERGREGWYTLPAMVVLAAGIFGGELHYFGTPGIWFPFGIGLSLGECAYAVFVPLVASMLLRRLWSFAGLSWSAAS